MPVLELGSVEDEFDDDDSDNDEVVDVTDDASNKKGKNKYSN